MKPRAVSKRAGKLFVISAPSGCGKTTLCKKLLDEKLGLSHSTSVTTRPIRKGEKEGVDYYFVNRTVFERMVERGEFLEHEANFDHLYGTPKKGIERDLRRGRSLLLSIDVKGAMNVQRLYPDESVLIFIMPPSIAALKKRLLKRSADGDEAIAVRLKQAKEEMGYKERYDYRVVNDRLDEAYKKVKNIIVSELNRKARGEHE